MQKKENLELNFIPKRNDSILAHRIIDGKVVVIDLIHSTLNTLNTTATMIWQLIDGNNSIGKIIDQFAEEVDISFGVAKDDILETIEKMISMGWIENFLGIKNYILKNDKKEKIFEELREYTTQKTIPLVVHFDLTYRCALRCIHCYLTNHNKRFECTLHEIKNILDQLADVGALYLTFSGGEIFLRDDLPEIITYARKLHFSVRLLTSGILIDQRMVNDIASWHPEMVAFSVYAMDPKIHDAITRKNGSLKKTLNSIELLRGKNVPIKISSVLMNKNINYYHAIHSFAKNIGAQFQADYRITPKTNGSKVPLKFHIKDEEIKRVLNDPVFSEDYDLDDPVLAEGYSGVFDTIPCGAGHMSCYISPSGMITPCVQVPIECGNLKEKTFSEIWNDSSDLDAFRKITFSKMPKCATCKIFSYCRPCPGLNLIETGSISVPPQRVCKEAEYMKSFNKKRR